MEKLIKVAMGFEKADLVLKGGNVINVYTGELKLQTLLFAMDILQELATIVALRKLMFVANILHPVLLMGICTLKAQCYLLQTLQKRLCLGEQPQEFVTLTKSPMFVARQVLII